MNIIERLVKRPNYLIFLSDLSYKLRTLKSDYPDFGDLIDEIENNLTNKIDDYTSSKPKNYAMCDKISKEERKKC